MKRRICLNHKGIPCQNNSTKDQPNIRPQHISLKTGQCPQNTKHLLFRKWQNCLIAPFNLFQIISLTPIFENKNKFEQLRFFARSDYASLSSVNVLQSENEIEQNTAVVVIIEVQHKQSGKRENYFGL